MSETQVSAEMIHAIRRVESYGVVTSITPPTTKPVEWFEEHERRAYPGCTMKPSRTYEPWVFGHIERMAAGENITIDEAIDRLDARKEAMRHEGDYFVWKFTDFSGTAHWVAAKTQEEASACMAETRPHDTVTDVEQATNLDEGGFSHGDVEEGEELTPCTLRDLIKWHHDYGTGKAMLIAEDQW